MNDSEIYCWRCARFCRKERTENIMKNEHNVAFVTIVPTGETPDAALHTCLVGDNVSSEMSGSGAHIMTLVAALVSDGLELARKEGGRLAEDMTAALVIRSLGDAVNRPLARAALKQYHTEEADNHGEV